MVKEPHRLDAIRRLVGGRVGGNTKGINVRYHDDQTPPSESDIDATFAELQAEYDADAYARNRAPLYDSYGDQLDQLMKDMRDGTTTHKTACEAVKAKFPKP